MSDLLLTAQRDLDAARDRQRRAAMGPPLTLSATEIAAAADVDEGDAIAAQALWAEANPGPLASLLDAEPDEVE